MEKLVSSVLLEGNVPEVFWGQDSICAQIQPGKIIKQL